MFVQSCPALPIVIIAKTPETVRSSLRVLALPVFRLCGCPLPGEGFDHKQKRAACHGTDKYWTVQSRGGGSAAEKHVEPLENSAGQPWLPCRQPQLRSTQSFASCPGPPRYCWRYLAEAAWHMLHSVPRVLADQQCDGVFHIRPYRYPGPDGLPEPFLHSTR
jgi:hypothetical protein